MSTAFQHIASEGARLQIEGVVDDAWAWLNEQAEELFDEDEAIEDDPEEHRETVEGYLSLLSEIADNLEASKKLLPADGTPGAAAWQDLHRAYVQRYNSLALGVLRDARAEDPRALPRTFGWAAVLIVAGVALGVGAVAWAVVAYEEAEATRDQTALMRADLEARDAASREGRTLQANTVDRPRPPEDGVPLWPFAVGALGAVGAAVLLYQASQSLRS